MAAQATMGITANGEEARARFEALIERHRKIVFKVANTYARSAEDRADLAQEIAAQAWRAFRGYDEGRSFSTWLYRIALNVAISHLRSAEQRERHLVAFDDDAHTDIADAQAQVGNDAEADARVRELYRCIARFAPLDRALLVLYLDEKNHREIAEILGISETNVATKINRLKQRLRADMGAEANT